MNLQAKFYPKTLEIFHRIQNEFPDSLLAGGALRDLVLERPIKDGDIFISGNRKSSILQSKIFDRNKNSIPFWHRILGDKNWHVSLQNNTYAGYDRNVDAVITLHNPRLRSKVNFNRFDIIFLYKSAKSYFLEDFDFNICKAAYDGSQYLYTNGFLQDASDKTITLSGPLDYHSIKYSLETHLPRIRPKYSNYKVVIPREYAEILRFFNGRN